MPSGVRLVLTEEKTLVTLKGFFAVDIFGPLENFMM